jgi:cyanophycin synthetase
MNQSFFPVAGFQGRLRQPEQTLRLQLSHCPQSIDWLGLDQWLSDRLGLSLQPPAHELPVFAEELGATADVVAVLWRILQVAAELQRVARLPVFEPGQLLNVQADKARPDGWLADVCVPYIDYVPANKTRLVYEAATLMVLGVASAPANFVETEPLYQQLEIKVLQPLRAAMPVGKSTLPLLACAHERRIPWRHLGAGVFQLGWGAQSMRMQNSKVGSDSALGVAVAQNKWVAAEWMRHAGLPAPHNRLATNEQEALAAQAALGWPLVVKPADRDRGEGVVVNITSQAQLLNAFRHALTLSSQILIERQADGVCHRVLVVRGQVIYAVKRLPIAVCGDGQQTVAQLVHNANQQQQALPSWARAPLYPSDELTKACLQQVGLNLSSVLAAGAWASLRPIESTEWGGLDEDYSSRLHPDNAALACRAACLFGLDVAGIDIISPDITQPWHANAAILNEVNSSPVLGQSESSRRTLPQVLKSLLPEQGRIRIEVFVGAEQALEMARAQQQAWQAQGIAGYLTSHNLTLTPSGAKLHLTQDSLFARCLALLADTQVEAIVLLVQTDELLQTGLPVSDLQHLSHSGEPLLCAQPDGLPTTIERTHQVIAFLQTLAAR